MNWMKVKIIIIPIFTIFVILTGQFHWNQKLQYVVADTNRIEQIMTIKSDEILKPSNVYLSTLMIDYEERFTKIITKYQEDVQELYNRAENEYYQTYLYSDHLMFRKFVSIKVEEIDVIYNEAKKQYDHIYNEFLLELSEIGYNYDDMFIYYVFFEEITMETHTAFITSLINLQISG